MHEITIIIALKPLYYWIRLIQPLAHRLQRFPNIKPTLVPGNSLYANGIVVKASWAHLSISHHFKPEPLGEDLVWWRAHLAVPNDAVCIFSYEYLFKAAKSNWAVKRFGESARWTDFTILLLVKANSCMSAINSSISHRLIYSVYLQCNVSSDFFFVKCLCLYY